MGVVAVCLPSRARPHLMRRFLDSYKNTHMGDSVILMRNGEDDPSLREYDQFIPECYGRVIGPDIGFAPGCQDLYESYPDFDYYLTMEDDCILLDKGWDEYLISEYKRSFPHGMGLVQLVDTSAQVRCEMVSRKWIETLGYFMVPYLREHAVEGLRLIGEGMGLNIWGHKARVEHKGEWRSGYSNGKTEWMTLTARENYQENERRIADWLANGAFDIDVRKIQDEVDKWPRSV